MTHTIPLSDEQYHTLEQLAAARGQTPAEVLTALVNEAWERACAPYDAAFHDDPEWLAGAQEAIGEVASGSATCFPSTAAFFQHLNASQDDVDAARQLDQTPPGPPDATAR